MILHEPRRSWLGLKRRQWVELEDMPWWPAPWRDAGTAFLALALQLSGHAQVLAERIEDLLLRVGERRVVDLGSGGGGPMGVVARAFGTPTGSELHIVLTDLYPNQGSLRAVCEASGGRISYRPDPVDATAVPPDLPGLRTMVNAFHHLPPEAARAVLQDAVRAGRPIAIYEVVSRSPLHLLGLLFAPLAFLLTFPLQRPFRPMNLLFTYVLPVLPLFVLFDGIVSWLRIHDAEELQELVSGLEGADGWRWHIGSFPLGSAPVHGVFLEGIPPLTE